MPIFQVDSEKCRRCGICSSVCPAQIIANDDSERPFLVAGGAERCIGCGQCVAFCPHGASGLDGLPMETVRRIDRKLLPSAESMAELMHSRRSIRVFADKKVARADIEKIVSMASAAPTAKNQRRVRWVIVEDEAVIQKLVSLVGDYMEELAGPSPETFAQRSAKLLATMVRKGKDPILRGAKQLAVAVGQSDPWGRSDAAIALAYFELAAHTLGVGCCWGGYLTSAASTTEGIKKILGVGPDEEVWGAQMFGLPAIRPTYTPPRVPGRIDWI